jgi:hypothetical protein
MSDVPRSQLVLVLASVFAGLTVVLAVLGFAYSPVALAVSLPFGAVTYALWYHASGRLHERVRREARTGRRTTTERGGFGAGPREDWTGPRGGGGGGGGFRDTRQRRTTQRMSGPSMRDAYRTLGLDPGADESAIKQAYREKVKETHPDTEEGTERRFKRVNEAYERLSE